MTPSRPPLSDRWEFHLAVGLSGLILSVLRARAARNGDAAGLDVSNPRLGAWLAARRAEQSEHPWRGQLAVERNALRAFTSLWLAWRAYRLERVCR